MSEMFFASGSVFRLRLMIGNALLQACAGIVVVLYLVALLQLTAEQWREFLVAGVIFAGVSALAAIWMQSRFDPAVVAAHRELDLIHGVPSAWKLAQRRCPILRSGSCGSLF